MFLVHIAGICLGIFLVILQLTEKNRNFTKYSGILLLLSICFFLGAPWYHDYHVVPLLVLVPAFPFLFGPGLYFYTASLTIRNFHLDYRSGIHVFPFLFFAIILAIYRNNVPGIIKPGDFMENNLMTFVGFSTTASFIGYGISILFLLTSHKRQIEECYSKINQTIDLFWLKLMVLVFMMIIVMEIILVQYAHFDKNIHWIPLIHAIGATFFIFYFGLAMIKQKKIYLESGNVPVPGKKYAKSSLNKNQISLLMEKIDEKVISEKPYLDSDLNIYDFAKKVGISRHHLTQVLNEGFRKNFYNYINEYRLKEAMERIRHPDFAHHSLLRIALDSGFNAKSSFNRVFKNKTGTTPREYKQTEMDL